jgi:response regulator RpfG family c-di-GMP phosphodiesterase
MDFADEPAPATSVRREPWTILIVDDEKEVHNVTQLALMDFEFAGRGLRFIHAYSGEDARRILAEQRTIALVLLDVVMETDQAGLDVVEFVRNELGDNFVRIILRTGQPGQAPELEVIRRYDINDYKHKTELTRQRLFTTVYTSLSTYRDLVALDATRRGLEKVIEASAHIFELRSLEHFAQGVLEQLAALLFLDHEAVIVNASGLAANESELRIIAGTGEFATKIGLSARDVMPPLMLARVEQALAQQVSLYAEDYLVGYCPSDEDLIFYVGADEPFSVPDRKLIEMFYRNVAIALENLRGRQGRDRIRN